MQPIDLETFDARTAEYDAVVSGCVDLDRFCSSSDWVLPAHRALMPAREPMLFEDAGAWLALARGRDPRGFSYLEPLEACWGLTCPLVGAPAAMLLEVCRTQPWDVMVLAGITDKSRTQVEIISEMLVHYELRQGMTTTRHVADLADGVDAFLARRSRNFRRSLHRSQRDAAREGIEIEAADDVEPGLALRRILEVDARSWKGTTRQGIAGGGMGDFYGAMIARLSARSALRLRFARHADRDVAFILGGLFAGNYRGLQFAYDANVARFGLGNLCQLAQMEALVAEGITTYDLGTTAGQYKRRWCDRVVESSTFLVFNG